VGWEERESGREEERKINGREKGVDHSTGIALQPILASELGGLNLSRDVRTLTSMPPKE
jgi:hypothetical protein